MADKRPIGFRWIFDPETNDVHLHEMMTGHPATRRSFDQLSTHVHHPDRTEGYAFSIIGGWRVTDRHGQKVEDPFVTKRVLAALNHENYTPLPHVLPHGDPLKYH